MQVQARSPETNAAGRGEKRSKKKSESSGEAREERLDCTGCTVGRGIVLGIYRCLTWDTRILSDFFEPATLLGDFFIAVL